MAARIRSQALGNRLPRVVVSRPAMSSLVKSHPDVPPIARTLEDIVRHCRADVVLEAGDPRWEDFSAARGDAAIPSLEKLFKNRPLDGFVHAALISHRGAGKSTEIRRLMQRLEDGYHSLYLEATTEMDPYRIEVEDLLLNLAIAVMEDCERAGAPLSRDLLTKVESFFSNIIRTTKWGHDYSAEASSGAEGNVSVPLVGKLFGGLKALFRHESEYRTEVKQELKKSPAALLMAVNELLDAASRTLGDRSLLIVLDNLDRYEPHVIDEVLIQGADRIRQLHCHLLLTPPVSLALQPKSMQLDHVYECQHLDTIRLRRSDQAFDEFDGPGRDAMEQALGKRMDLSRVMPDQIVRDRLIAASGGAIRELLDLVTQSALLANGASIAIEDVEKTLKKRKARLRDLINVNGWLGALVTIGRTHQLSADPKCRDVLFQRMAFRYNGDGWYDVHPLVAELEEYRHALATS